MIGADKYMTSLWGMCEKDEALDAERALRNGRKRLFLYAFTRTLARMENTACALHARPSVPLPFNGNCASVV